MEKKKRFRVPKPLKVRFKGEKPRENPNEKIFDIIFTGFLLFLLAFFFIAYVISLQDSGLWKESRALYGMIIFIFVFLGIILVSIFISKRLKREK